MISIKWFKRHATCQGCAEAFTSIHVMRIGEGVGEINVELCECCLNEIALTEVPENCKVTEAHDGEL